jgi:hypothetical protein
VLRLIEVFGERAVTGGVEQALDLGALGFDTVKH